MPHSLGTFIRERRQDLGLTQEDLAERIGPSLRQGEVSRLEHNRIALPRRDRLEAIAAALEVSPLELLLRSGWMTNGDRLEAAVLQVQTLETTDALTSQSVAELAEVVADVQAMVADATQIVEAAVHALAHAQARLRVVLHAVSDPLLSSNGHLALPDLAGLPLVQSGAHAGSEQD